jgi:glycosyltransferase involved in cell wall biosynthesis
LNIVHLGPVTLPALHTHGGAVQRRMIEVAALQAAAGNNVTIYSVGRFDGTTTHRGVEIRYLKLRSRRPLRDYELLIRARRLCARTSPDVVHFHGIPDGARFFSGLAAPSVLSVDYFRFRGSATVLMHKYYAQSLAKFDQVLPVSHSCDRMFHDYWKGTIPTTVVPNGVNVRQFAPCPESGASLRKELELHDTLALYVGRLCVQKGTPVLLDAWEKLAMAPKDAQLVVAGPLEQFGRAERGPLTERIERIGGRYLGAVPDKILPALYNACEVFIMPTLEDEMFGMAALEAQACGKPVVSSRWGGLLEAVGPESGTFVEPGDPSQLASAIGALLSDGPRTQAMGAAARAFANNYRWELVVDQLDLIYKQAMSRTCR